MSTSTQQSKASIQKLITLERAQKLDLLIHLISNLRQSLIICGPEGIGKTTILDAMLENNNDSWPICLLQGTSSLSFESILDKFSQQLTQLLPEHAGQDLSAILENYNKQNQKIVLIIDDAGVLVPGLVSALIEFANANASLRLVLSLTYDELHVKNSSDRIIDECHLIEIPPITKKQCTDFLLNLSAQPGAAISFNAVTEGLVDNLYRQTHGIPGKIVTELPRLASYKMATGLKWGAGSFVIITIVCAIGLFYLNRPESQMAESLIKKKPVAVEIVSPVIQSEKNEQIDRNVDFYKKLENNKKETVSIEVENKKNEVLPRDDTKVEVAENELLTTKEKATETAELVQATTEIAEAKKEKDKLEHAITKKQIVVDKSKKTVPESKTDATETAEPVQATTEIAEAKKGKDKQEDVITEKQVVVDKSKKTVPVPRSVEAVLDDAAWVSSQSAENYTMQLMVLSKRQSVEDLLKKYQHHKDLLKSFQIKKKDQSKYVVIYGSYKTSADATKAKQTLPTAFRKAWVRKFKPLQKQIKAN